MSKGKWQFSIGQLALAMIVVAALLGWWKLFGFDWIGPVLLGLLTFLGVVASVDGASQRPLRVAQFLSASLGFQVLVFLVAVREGSLKIAFYLYVPVYRSLAAFEFGKVDFRHPDTVLWVQTGLGVFSYAAMATGAWAWWMGYATEGDETGEAKEEKEEKEEVAQEPQHPLDSDSDSSH